MDTNDSSVSHVGANDADLAAGQAVGEYVVEGKIGEGGFGTVFRATHPLIGKQVAIKVLSRQYSANAEMVSRFQAEARAVNQIRHRNIIDIFSFGQLEDGRSYYVMELLEGQPLDSYLEINGALPLEEALPVLRDIARALDSAHANDIVHRDLKPENVFLAQDPDGAVFPKLLDFGIAKLMTNQGQKHRTQTGAPIGTPAYMSPEQCRGRDVDHRTDIYAFGVLAYEVLTGHLPFESEEYMEVILAHLQNEPEPPSSKLPSLPKGLDACILTMLAKDPAQRPPHLSDAVAELETVARSAGLDIRSSASPTGVHGAASRGEQGSRASASGRASAGGLATAISNAQTIDAEHLSGQMRESGVLAAAEAASSKGRSGGVLVVAAVLVAAIGAGGWYVLGSRSDGEAGAVSAEPAAKAAAAAIAPTETPVAPATGDAAGPAGANAARPGDEAADSDGDEAAARPEAPTVVTLSIDGPPAGTEVYGPNGPLGVAPGTVTLPRGEAAITLSFQAEGYRLATRSVVPDQDRTLNVALEEKRRRAAARPKRRSPAQKKPKPKPKRDRSQRDEIEDPFAN